MSKPAKKTYYVTKPGPEMIAGALRWEGDTLQLTDEQAARLGTAVSLEPPKSEKTSKASDPKPVSTKGKKG